jgi:hypothetical protein
LANQIAHTERRRRAQRRKKPDKEKFVDVIRRMLTREDRYKNYCRRWDKTRIRGDEELYELFNGIARKTHVTLNCLRLRAMTESGLDIPDGSRYGDATVAVFEQNNRHFYPDYSRVLTLSEPLDGSCLWSLEDYVERGEKTPFLRPLPVRETKTRLSAEAALNQPPTRLFQVFRDQKWSTATAFLYFVLIGRWCYGRGRPDNWHVLPYDVGVAGAGKGVHMAVKKALWPDELCADLQFGDTTPFALGDCADAQAVYINEVENKPYSAFSIPLLNKMGAAESVDCNRKYGGKKTLRFYHPVWLNGNTMIRYRQGVSADEGFARRLAPFPFLYRMNNTATSNTEIDREIIDNELTQILVQSTFAYHQFWRGLGNKPFPLSHQMRCFHKTLLSQTLPMVWFFRLCLARVPDSFHVETPVTFRDLNERFRQFFVHFCMFPQETEITPDMVSRAVKSHKIPEFSTTTTDGVDVLANAVWRDYGDDWLQGANPSNVAKFRNDVLLDEDDCTEDIAVPDWFEDAYEI